MKKIIEFLRNHHHQIYKVMLFLLAIILIVIVFPREAKFKYEFQKGKPWPHEDLIADFDFPIYKSEEALEKEEEMIREEQAIYFFDSPREVEEAYEEYQNNFELEWQRIIGMADSISYFIKEEEKEAYYTKGKELMGTIYEKGLLQLHPRIEGEEKTFEIQILRNNVSESYRLEQLFTISEAFEFIRAELEELNSVEQSLILNTLEESLKRNISYDKETNDHFLQLALDEISPTAGMIQEGERVIAKGDVLNDERFQLLSSLKKEYESQTGRGESGKLDLAWPDPIGEFDDPLFSTVLA